MKRISENQKVTLTLGQLRKLVRESISDEGDFEIKNGVLVKYHGEGGDVVIPDGVVEIGNMAFARCKTISSVSIPDTVTKIGWLGFGFCSIESIVIPDSVKLIFDQAFEGCANLKYVQVDGSPDGTKIGGSSFCACRKLTKVVLGDWVVSIGKQAFYGCSELKEVKLPESLMYEVFNDPNYAFWGSPFAKAMLRKQRKATSSKGSDDEHEVSENESRTKFIGNRIGELMDDLNGEFGG